MATTTKAAAPAKKSGFGGVKEAWIILAICCAAGYSVWYFVMGNPDNFIGGDRTGHPANLLGTVYKGGFVVGLILTLLFTVICLGFERFFAIKSASGKMNLAKFTAQVKAAVKDQKFDEAKALGDAYPADEHAYGCYHRISGYPDRSVRYCARYDRFVPGSVCWWWC